MQAWRLVALASIAAGGACGSNAEPTGNIRPESFVVDDDVIGHRCEGPEALACPSGTYCATSMANHCPSAEMLGKCHEIPQVCTHIFEPTCGCDGQTYASDCQAAAAGVAIAYEGPCAPFCGGFAGLPCPGAGTCVDNTTDACDPADGDVDCASLCRCEVEQPCDEGAHWNGAPEVCACVLE